MKVHTSLVCPGGVNPPKGADIEDLLDAWHEAARSGTPAALVMVCHVDGELAKVSVDAAAWTLERTL